MKTEQKSEPSRRGAGRSDQPALSLRQIETLHTVLSTRSITAAAKLLNVSQPSISRTVKRIEDVLRLRLFTKDGKRLVPTKEAMQIFEEVDGIMGQLTGLGRRIARIASSSDGVFRLGATASVARAVVPQAIHNLSRLHPGLDLFLDVLSIDQMAQYLLTGTGDCLVTIAPDKHPALASMKLGEGVLVALLNQHHPLAQRPILAAKDLVGHEIICFQSDGPHQRAIRAFLDGVVQIDNPRMVVRFSDTAIALASQGMGIALIDSFSIRGQIGPDLVAVPLQAPPRFEVFLQWNRGRPASRNLDRLADELRGLLAPNP
ncbi:LysR family transcriptional regulator [Paracoccus sp. KR1-242]|uniref:LysR family transcriptional regulator n=1 Tax=Paracoccus sp. KR1-242 TaxID=3410028 RepID=UPI003C2D3F45